MRRHRATVVDAQSGKAVTGFPPAVPGGSWKGKYGHPTGPMQRGSPPSGGKTQTTGRKKMDNLIDMTPGFQLAQDAQAQERNVRQSMGLAPTDPYPGHVLSLDQFR